MRFRQKLIACVASGILLTMSTGNLPASAADGKPALPAVVRSAKSGLWSAPTSWAGGKVPGAGARVLIREGHSIVYDLHSDQAIRGINVAGILSFAADKDTRLDVGLIKIQAGEEYSEDGFDCDAHIPVQPPHPQPLSPGGARGEWKPRPALEVGTPATPIPANRKALIRLVYFPGMDKDSCPAIVCCGGRMDLHGAPMSRTWVKLGRTAAKGAKTIMLHERVEGWRVGDRIIVTATQSNHKTSGTRRPDQRTQDVFTEERLITAIDGVELTLDKELTHEHRGAGDYRGAVANLSRNVVVESANAEGQGARGEGQAGKTGGGSSPLAPGPSPLMRGHTMYHRGSTGAISYAEFRHLGKEGLLGRYALHFHLCSDTMRGSYVVGASIWDSHNRWLTIHGTNYLVVRDCVGYQSVGHGFFLEDGTEVYNVLDRNLAVQAYLGKKLPKQVHVEDTNDGAGFWWANSLNTFTRNVSCENDRYGFRYDARPIVSRAASVTFRIQQPDGSRQPVDIRTLPFVRFEDNEAHCDGAYGLNLGNGVERVGPDRRHPFVIRGMKIWDTHLAFVPAPPCVLVEDMRIFNTVYGVYLPNYDHHVYRNMHMIDVFGEPFNRGHDDRSIQYGPLTVDGLTFEGKCANPLIQISDDNPTGTAVSHFKAVKVVGRPEKLAKYTLVNLGVSPRPGPKTPQGVPIYLHDYYGAGRHAKVVSTRAKDLIGDGGKFRAEPPLTGDESRVTEVADVKFPQLLDPVDDLPPTTVITHIRKMNGGKLQVAGTTADNGAVKRVVVNGKEAKAVTPNFAQWDIVLSMPPDGVRILEAFAEDSAGNIEKRAHAVVAK